MGQATVLAFINTKGCVGKTSLCASLGGYFADVADPPQQDAAAALAALCDLGVQTKIISGDNEIICNHVAAAVGMLVDGVIGGAELAAMLDDELWQRASRTNVFAEVYPHQKDGSFARCNAPCMWSATWATASTTRRSCTGPM